MTTTAVNSVVLHCAGAEEYRRLGQPQQQQTAVDRIKYRASVCTSRYVDSAGCSRCVLLVSKRYTDARYGAIAIVLSRVPDIGFTSVAVLFSARRPTRFVIVGSTRALIYDYAIQRHHSFCACCAIAFSVLYHDRLIWHACEPLKIVTLNDNQGWVDRVVIDNQQRVVDNDRFVIWRSNGHGESHSFDSVGDIITIDSRVVATTRNDGVDRTKSLAR